MKRLNVGLVLCVLIAFAAGRASAQATSGSIYGTVTDSTGAAIPDATVTVTDVAKGTAFNTTTNAEGYYTVTRLIPDVYTVSVVGKGFNTAVQDNVAVMADAGVKVNIGLKVGQVTETVQVTSATPLLKTDRADVATTLDTRQVTDTPVANRNFSDLELLMPGTVMLGWQHASSENPQRSAQIQVNGQGFFGTDYLLDGTDNRDPILGIIVINPDLDSIQEVKMTTSNFDAEFGTATAGVMSAQTKSGTNQVYGEGFDYIQNDQFIQARDPFQQSKPNPITGKFNNPLRYNQFGGNVGGAIIKNKLFYFGDYQGLRRHQTNNRLTFVPTAAERNGDFSALLANPDPKQDIRIYDPNTGNPDGSGRTPFANNIIPANRIDPVAAKVMGLLPAPNFVSNDPTINFLATGREAFNSNAFDTREDWFVSDKTQVFGRYSLAQYGKTAPGAFGTDLGGPALNGVNFAGVASSRDQSVALGATHSFSPSLLSEFRFGYMRYRVNVDMGGAGKDLGKQLGINGVNLGDFFTSGLPAFGISGHTAGVGGLGTTTLGYSVHDVPNNNQCNCPLRQLEYQEQFVNNWTKLMGEHQFKWGADVRHADNLRVPSDNNRNGQFFFDNSQTSSLGDNSSGLGLATLLLGQVSRFKRYVSPFTDAHESQNRFFLYGQDTYRLSNSVTVNYGLRWEYYQPQQVNAKGKGGWFDFTNANVIVAGYGPYNLGGSVTTAWHNFVPRLGVSWQHDPKTVVRVGYGRSFDIGVFGTLFGHTVTQNLPVLAFQDVTPPNGNGLLPAFGLSSPNGPPSGFALFPDPSTYASSGIFPLPKGVNIHADERKEVVPYVDSWNLSVQRQLNTSTALEVAYVGNKGTHLGSTPNINAPTVIPAPNDPTGGAATRPYLKNFGLTQGITDYCNCDSNNYNAMQVKLTKSFTKGLEIFANYSWGRSMNFNGNWVYGWRNGYGPSDTDITHVLNITHSYELPFGKGRTFLNNAGSLLNAAVGGWTFNGQTAIHSGLASTPGYNGQGCRQCPFQTWPDRVGDPYSGNGAGSQQSFWNRTAFVDVPPNLDGSGNIIPGNPQRNGGAGRNSLRGPGFWTSNLSMFKTFDSTERAKLQLRVEAFNAFNHVNWGVPSSYIDGSNYGKVNYAQGFAPDLSPVRSGQIALKLSF